MKVFQIILLMLVVVITILGLTQTYRVQSGATADLLSGPDDAYLFVNVYQKGWHLSYLQYLAQIAKEYFRAGTPYNDKQSSLLVLRITSSGVEKSPTGNLSLGDYTPLGKDLFANSNGTWMKLVDSHFEVASQLDRERLSNVKSRWCSDSMIDCWNMQASVLNRNFQGENEFPLELGGKKLVLFVKHDRNNRAISIDLQGLGGARQNIWNLDQVVRKVGHAEYEKIFRE